MSEIQVSIGRVKREISELVNRVAYGDEHIVLTSRGKPKAVIVSLEDYARLQQVQQQAQIEKWEGWLTASQRLSQKILAERDGEPVDVDAILKEDREELEGRHDEQLDH